MVLEAHMALCLAVPDFLLKIFTPKKGANEQNKGQL